jgi:hypothetical protein
MKRLSMLFCLVLVFMSPLKSFAEKQPPKNDEISFQFFINPIAGPEESHIELFLTNEGVKTLEFEAPTSQWYDLEIFNQKKEMVYDYAKGKFFLQAIQKIILKPGETKIWVENINKPTGKNLAPGKYTVIAQLKATNLNGESIKGYHTLMDEAEMVVPPENPIIKNVNIEKNNGNFMVTGKAKPTTGEIFYVVEDGHHEWIQEKRIKLSSDHASWSEFSFEVTLPKDKKTDTIPYILYLYEKDEKGNIIHSYPKILK